MADVRVTNDFAQVATGAASARVVHIGPDLPNLATLIKGILWVSNIGASGSVGGLSFNRLLASPLNVRAVLEAASVWQAVIWEAEEATIYVPLPGDGLLVGGPQLWVIRNDAGLTGNFAIYFYYETVRVGVTQYSILRRRTSYEEGE